MKKSLLFFVFILALVCSLPVMSQSVETEAPSVDEIDKYGDIRLSITSEELAELGFEYADYVTVSFLDQSVVLPVIPAYRYVGAKASALVMWADDPSKPVELEVFNGSFASSYGLAERFTREDGSRYHEAMEGIEFPVAVTIEMAEKGGYADTYAIFNLERFDSIEEYEGLTEEQFANYRMVASTGMGSGKLYRSSSPVNPSIGRNVYADHAAEADGVLSFINLADSAESAAKFEGFDDSYYSKQNVLYLNLGVDFTSDLNRNGLVEMMNFLAESPTPVLVHCNEGQDRAGVVSAMLECLMGASYDEIVDDYMVTFFNYYGVEPGTDQYAQLSNNIKKNLSLYFGIDDIETADLAEAAENYFKSLGVSEETIAAVKANLSGDVSAYTEEDIFIDAGDHQIPATVTIPAGDGPFPFVVMLHGNGSTRHEAGNAYDYTAPEMAKAGIATIRFDYIGNGDSTSDYIDFTYDKGVADAMACYEYMAALDNIDGTRAGVMGWSQGGRLALLTAGRTDVFKSVLTWAGAYDQKGSDAEQYEIAKAEGYYLVEYSWRDPLKQSPEYYEVAMAIDYPAEVGNIKAPILAINGTEDTTVIPETAQKIIDASVNPDSRVLLLDGADHTFLVFTGDLSMLQKLTDETIQWFAETL